MLYIVESLERFIIFTKGSHPVSKYKKVIVVLIKIPVTILAAYSWTNQLVVLRKKYKFELKYLWKLKFKGCF